jgi:molecular chaperone IbpA
MTKFDLFPTLNPFSIGFDDAFKRLTQFHDDMAKAVPGYPPYNIRKVEDNKYLIELALAGFSRNDIEILLEDNVLKISGKSKSDDSGDSFLYKGIAERAFNRTFSLADTIEVKNADLINGMLKIWLENIIPDNKKSKKIDINDAPSKTSKKEKELLVE